MTIMNDENLKKLHNTLLDMYKDVDKISISNDINLFMGGGTMLGAVRHGGFIPWDDDLDLMILRKDVLVFLEQFKESEKYFVQFVDRTKDYPYSFIKIRKKGTMLRENYTSNYPISSEIFIDVFIIENIPNNIIRRKMHGFYCDLITRIAHITYNDKYSVYIPVSKLSTKMKIRSLVCKILTMINKPTEWVIKSEKVNSKYAAMQTNDITIPTGRKKYFGEIYPKHYFENYKQIMFEDHFAKCTPFFTEYLTNLYGNDYMRVPEPDKRESHDIIEFKD